jgi:hypothetical protein
MSELSAPQVAEMQKRLAEVLQRVYDDTQRRERVVALVLEHAGAVIQPEAIVNLVIDLHRFITLPADVARSAEVVTFKKDEA